MIGPKLASTMSEVDQLTVLPRNGIERIGRRRSLFRALAMLVVIFALLVPVSLVRYGAVPAVAPVPPTVTAGLLLIITGALIPFAVQFGWRCIEISHLGGRKRYRVMARCLFGALLVAAAARLIETVVDWREHVWPALGEVYPIDRVLFLFDVIVGAAALIGLAVVALIASRDPLRSERPVTDRQDPPTVPNPPTGTIICCSGGGIRAASFCLGGLQLLAEQKVYATARAVVGVSGGGYIAAALHVLRWRSEEVADERQWHLPEPGPFAPTSPEFRFFI